ncbi:MAG TPA: HAMP domain-containing sensor histidine kinase [Chitinophagaceae bacterium]|nr:HAMP domain-containing sensor histidine kinase [Chitinophagaceae bacterium]
MKNRFGIFRRISVLVFVLITVLSVLFIIITYLSATHFYKASTQRLNREVAAHIAKFTSPFEGSGINKQIADSVFFNAMVINPSIEVYFLDTAGKVMYYQSPDSTIYHWQVPLAPIKKYIRSGGTQYITGLDPKSPGEEKVFSATEVTSQSKSLGYIYVVLGGKEHGNVTDMLFGSHVGGLAIKAFVVVIILSLLISFYYISRLQKNYREILSVLDRYRGGDLSARFDVKRSNEFAPITESFNHMAEQLSENLNRLRTSEKERKDFVANISHDLRTPLAVAKGYTETLLNNVDTQKPLTEQEIEYTRLVLKKIDQVEKMVMQLFELSKMESLETTPRCEPFIFSEVLEELVMSYEQTAKEKSIQLSCTGCQETYWVNADIRMMERVIQNLMDNAIKYTPEHGSIHVSLELRENKLIASFENTGNSLPGAIVQWVNDEDGFEKTLRPGGSSGLGLPIVKKILSMHQFPFSVQTAFNFNRFIFRMPLLTSR